MFKPRFRQNDVIRNDNYLLRVLKIATDGYFIEVMDCITDPHQAGRYDMLWAFNSDSYILYHREIFNYNTLWQELNV